LHFSAALQLTLLIILNIGMICYISEKRPFTRLVKNIEAIFYESCLFVANFCVLGINSAPSLNSSQLVTAVIAIDIIMLMGSILFTLNEVYQAIRKIINKHRLGK
jgi:hypothetical protein